MLSKVPALGGWGGVSVLCTYLRGFVAAAHQKVAHTRADDEDSTTNSCNPRPWADARWIT